MIRRCVFLQLLLSAAIAGIISTTAFAQYNTAEISGIVHDCAHPNFGRIFSAQPARQMQFGVKFLF